MRLRAVTFEASDPVRAAQFWAALLRREALEDSAGEQLPGTGAQLGLRFVAGRAGRLGENRMHLHLTSADLDEQRRTVAMALEIGGTPRTEPSRQRFELLVAAGGRQTAVGELMSCGATRSEIGADGAVVLADPDGNEFTVRERGDTVR